MFVNCVHSVSAETFTQHWSYYCGGFDINSSDLTLLRSTDLPVIRVHKSHISFVQRHLIPPSILYRWLTLSSIYRQ